MERNTNSKFDYKTPTKEKGKEEVKKEASSIKTVKKVLNLSGPYNLQHPQLDQSFTALSQKTKFIRYESEKPIADLLKHSEDRIDNEYEFISNMEDEIENINGQLKK